MLEFSGRFVRPVWSRPYMRNAFVIIRGHQPAPGRAARELRHHRILEKIQTLFLSRVSFRGRT